jgi:hypothetical protein
MAIKKIIFFCATPFTKRDYDRFGGDILQENGFEVWFYDLSPIVFPKLYHKCVYPDLYEPQNFVRFLDERQVEKYIGELSPDSFVVTIISFGSSTYKIFQALSKTKLPYCLLTHSTFPVGDKKNKSKILSIAKNIFSLHTDTLKKIIYRPKFAKLLRIRPPDFCIVANKISFERNKAQGLFGAHTKILWAHSLDYNIYLNNNEKKIKPASNLAIFLDPQAPLFPGDSLAMGFKSPITAENYFPSICRFFDFAEKQLNIKINIAAHPKSNHPLHPEYYGSRQTLLGDTFGMIKNSRFIMSHASTAIQFAILLKKPIIFITTKEFEGDAIFSSDIKAFAQSMGKTAINIDEPLTVDWEKELFVDEKIYDDYINLYIKKRGTEELNTWQILANELKDFESQENALESKDSSKPALQ